MQLTVIVNFQYQLYIERSKKEPILYEKLLWNANIQPTKRNREGI